MKRMLFAAVALAAASFSSAAMAGPYTDKAAQCLAKSATAEDRTALMRWLFTMMAADPSVASFVSISEAQQLKVNQDLALRLQRLVLETCRKDSMAAVRHEEDEAMDKGFDVLMSMAAEQMIDNPSVTGKIEAFAEDLVNLVEVSRWKAFLVEALKE